MQTVLSGDCWTAYSRWSIYSCGLLFLCGCGAKDGSAVTAKMVPVQGKVSVAGKLLTEGVVTFAPVEGPENAPMPSGPIQSDGTYTLATEGKPGAPVGKYRVAVDPGGDKEALKQIDRNYGYPLKSPLQVEVEENKPAGGYDLQIPSRWRR